MIDVIQIYKRKEIFLKGSYTPKNRKEFDNIVSSYKSANGYLDKEVLYLPIELKDNPDLKTAQLVIIQDIKGWDPIVAEKQLQHSGLPDWFIKSRQDFIFTDNKTVFTFNGVNSLNSFEIFKIVKSEHGAYDLFLDYKSNASKIGVPERENHKLYELKVGKPIRYKINGKSDFTLSGRKQRTFYEYDYSIEWVGSANSIQFKEQNRIHKEKQVPLGESKLIDERKMLKY